MSSLDICLISLDAPFLANPLTHPQLGILYVSSYLKKHGYHPKVIDLCGGIPLPDNLHADIFGISSTSPQFPLAVNVMRKLRVDNSSSIFVIGGAMASTDSQSCLRAGFDIVVVGDGEEAMLKIMRQYEALKSEALFTTKTGSGGFKYPHPYGLPAMVSSELSSSNAKFAELDMLPFPDRKAIDLMRYHYYIEGRRATNIMTQRGCPFACSFCCHWDGYRKIRYHSPEYVTSEMLWIMENWPEIRAFMIYDDEFNLNKKRTIELCRSLKGLDVKLRCFIRTDLFDEEVAKAFVEAGVVEVCAGVESGSPKIKKIINKGTTVEQDTQARAICKDHGIRFKAMLMIGNPGETRETVEETIRWLATSEPDNFECTIFVPFPGTHIWEHPELYDIKFDKDEIIANNYGAMWFLGNPKSLVETSGLTKDEIVLLRDKIEEECGRRIDTEWTGSKPLPEPVDVQRKKWKRVGT